MKPTDTRDFDPSWAMAEHDLSWFFREAASACGLSSSMGPFLDILRSGSPLKGNSRKLRDAPDTIDGMVADFARYSKRIRAYSEARRIHHRLAAVGPSHSRTLELAYGCEHVLQRVSLSLACDCTSAQVGYSEALRVAHATALKAKEKGASQHQGQPQWHQQHKHSPKRPESFTVRSWVLWLAVASKSASGAAERAMLERIMSEANARLYKALRAYCSIGRVEACGT